MQDQNLQEALKNWRPLIQPYQQPNTKKAIIQIINSFIPFIGILIIMYFSLNVSYLLTLGLASIAAFFLVRIFIIQHDCGHQSFLKSRKWNNLIGFFSSIFSTIPFKYWSRTHNAHHAHNGQLEFRGIGDTYFKTTKEFEVLSSWGQLWYRIYRSPLVQFLIAPLLYFTVMLRYPFTQLKSLKKARTSLFLNNLLVLVIYSLLGWIIGWQKMILIHVPILLAFSLIAFWFFYVQHQHEMNYKEMKENWNHLLASVRGSTYYKLPKLFQWLSGNIGFHHIHHLSSRIPNYNLELCAKENPILNEFVSTLTFRSSLKCINHKLWDDEKQRMISFKEFYRAVKKESTKQ
jgi:omega-6 fatty acid desaturase (delta-12 desaturase)